jgi:hypothetical protein
VSPAARPSLRCLRRAGALASLLACLGLVACGGPAEPGVDPSPSPSAVSSADAASPAEDADRVVIDITLADGRVSPNGEKVDVAVGQEVVILVTSDTDDEIHAHTDDPEGYELPVRAGEPATGSFTISAPGSFEVESHHLEMTIVILNVR